MEQEWNYFFLSKTHRARNNKHHVRKTKYKLLNKSLTVWAKRYWALRGCTISFKHKKQTNKKPNRQDKQMLEKPQLEIKITKGLDGSGKLKALSMYPPSIFEAPLPVSPLLAASNASVLKRTKQNQWLLLNHVIYFIQRDFQLFSSFAPQDGSLPIRARLITLLAIKIKKEADAQWVSHNNVSSF